MSRRRCKPLEIARPLALAAIAALCAPVAATADPGGVCASADQLFVVDGLDGIASPCTVPAHDGLLESLYLQDASRVGGSALAAYPLVRFRAGVGERADVFVDAPSEIAESGAGGRGLYPQTHPGAGATFGVADTDRLAMTLGIEVLPPVSHFATSQTQPLQTFDLSSAYAVSRRIAVQAFASDASPGRGGAPRQSPSAALGAAYSFVPATQLSVDVGTRSLARRAELQKFGTVTASERLGRTVTFDAGVGTAFNASANAKPHYLASGLDYRF